jgi:aminoglycoside phosphotransferase (APT) family kinase protein
MNESHTAAQRILRSLNVEHPVRLGEGAETVTYTYTEEMVIKIYRYQSPDKQQTNKYLSRMQEAYKVLNAFQFSFHFPEMYEFGEQDGYFFTTEKRLTGTPVAPLYEKLAEAERRTFLTHFFETLTSFQSIRFDAQEYGQLFDAGPEIRNKRWDAFLLEMVARKLAISKRDLQEDLIDARSVFEQFQRMVDGLPPNPVKHFVHGDYFLGNILVDGNLNVTAVLDIGPLSAVGDFRMDVAGALAFLDIYPFTTSQDRAYLMGLATEQHGEAIARQVDIYTVYYSLLFSDCKRSDPTTYYWSIKKLKEILFASGS